MGSRKKRHKRSLSTKNISIASRRQRENFIHPTTSRIQLWNINTQLKIAHIRIIELPQESKVSHMRHYCTMRNFINSPSAKKRTDSRQSHTYKKCAYNGGIGTIKTHAIRQLKMSRVVNLQAVHNTSRGQFAHSQQDI